MRQKISCLIHGGMGDRKLQKSYYYLTYLTHKSTEEKCAEHKEYCGKKGSIIFQKHVRVPSVVFADLECTVEKPADVANKTNHTILGEHKPIVFSYSITSIDLHCRCEEKTYTGVNCVEKFLKEMFECRHEVHKIYKKSMPMKKLSESELNQLLAEKCFLCGNHFMDANALSKKQADHCHTTGKYRGAACRTAT